MKCGAFIAKSLIAFCKSEEVLRGFRYCLPIESYYDPPQWLAAMCNVEVDLNQIKWLAMKIPHDFLRTLFVIFGPLVASEVSAKRKKTVVKMRNTDDTNR